MDNKIKPREGLEARVDLDQERGARWLKNHGYPKDLIMVLTLLTPETGGEYYDEEDEIENWVWYPKHEGFRSESGHWWSCGLRADGTLGGISPFLIAVDAVLNPMMEYCRRGGRAV